MSEQSNSNLARKLEKLFVGKKSFSYFQNECAEDENSVYYGNPPETKVYALILTVKDIFNVFGLRVKKNYWIQIGPNHDPEFLTVFSEIGQKYTTLNQHYLDLCFDIIEPKMKKNVKGSFVSEEYFYMDSLNHLIGINARLPLEMITDEKISNGEFMLYLAYYIKGIEDNLKYCRKELKTK